MAVIDKPRLAIKHFARGKWQPIVTGDVSFSAQESAAMDEGELEYALTCELWEEDRFSDDDLIRGPVELARYPGGPIDFVFRMDMLATEDVDQEWGTDEIYGLLKLHPTKGKGETFEFKTNVLKRRFKD